MKVYNDNQPYKSLAGDQLWNSGRQNWIFGRIGDQEGAISDPVYYVALHQQFQVKLPHLQSAWHQEETLQYLENETENKFREIMNPSYSDSRIEEKEPQFYPKYCIN